MSHLDILLPFGLPPPDLAKDLARELKTPALAALIARGRAATRVQSDQFLRTLPHEAWLAGRAGLEPHAPAVSSPPLAQAAMASLGLAQAQGAWFLLHPAVLHISSSQLILTDLRHVNLSEQESRALYETALALFAAAGKTLVYGDAQTWFVRADDWVDLATATPDSALGQNIYGSMPQGERAREWRQLQNEVQMHWHTHPVNAAREERGLKPVNSIWLWGGCAAVPGAAPGSYGHMFNLPGWMRGYARGAAAESRNATLPEVLAAAPQRGLLFLDGLVEPALGGDWRAWLDRIDAFEIEWFAPLLTALRAGRLERVSLILSNGTACAEYTTSRHALRKFWIRPGLTRLQT